MSKITTKTGDNGTTGLIGNKRVKKYDLIIDSVGTVDEANAQIGFSRSLIKNKEINDLLLKIQKDLFTLMSEISGGQKIQQIKDIDIDFLEEKIKYYSDKFLKKFEFVIPGKEPITASLHVTRTVVRRAERRIVELSENQDINKNILIYMNRLSDLLFVLSLAEEKYLN